MKRIPLYEKGGDQVAILAAANGPMVHRDLGTYDRWFCGRFGWDDNPYSGQALNHFSHILESYADEIVYFFSAIGGLLRVKGVLYVFAEHHESYSANDPESKCR